MREIKYRGLNEETGEWAIGYLFPCSLLEDPDYLSPLWIATGFENECLPVDEETVGQFTGLRDKNGKEIYEGDILSYYSALVPKGSNPIVKQVVTWKEYQYAGINNWGGAEIIGNIHENPELLEGRERKTTAHGQKTLTGSGTRHADRLTSSTPERRKKTITGTARTAGMCLTYHGNPWYSV